MTLRGATLALAGLALAACANDLVVEHAADREVKVHSVNLQYAEKTQGVPAPIASYLRLRMDDSLYSRDPAFGRGGDLTVRYWLASARRGNRLSRFLLGSKTVLEAEIVGPQGAVLVRVRSQEDISLLPGASSIAIDRAVAEVRKYLIAHFQR